MTKSWLAVLVLSLVLLANCLVAAFTPGRACERFRAVEAGAAWHDIDPRTGLHTGGFHYGAPPAAPAPKE